MRYLPFFFLLLFTTPLPAQSTVEQIPNQKLINGSYVSNPDGILDGVTVAQIDTLLRSLEARTSAQVAVVALKSIGEADVFEFAQDLFNTWGIGKSETDNGLLVLLVEDQHEIRFHTGDGIEGVLPDVLCKRIQRDYMVPRFKTGDYNAGMLAGIQQVEKVLSNPDYAEELREPEGEKVSGWVGFVTFLTLFVAPVLIFIFVLTARSHRFKDSKDPEYSAYPELRLTRWTWLILFAGIPVAIVVLFGMSSMDEPGVWCFLSLYLYFLFTAVFRLRREKKVINRLLKVQCYSEIVEFLRSRQWYWLFMALLFPLPFVFHFVYHLFSKRMYRNHRRNCKQCQGAMYKLNDIKEDQYLSEGQQMEEKLRSIDYDVWKCSSCESVEFWFYLNRNSRYDQCPKCKTMAYHSTSTRTITSASYSASGSGEEIHLCKFCGYQKKSTYSIPQLTRSTPSSSSGFSSSSGGGSWGGGSSSGGGASSRW